MNETLTSTLRSRGWKPGTFKGFWRTSRAGIEWEVGRPAGQSDRLALRYRYHTERTDAEGEETLPADATLARIEDVMTSVYLRVHEKPDVSRVFGAGKRRAAASPAAAPEETQGALDL